MNALPHLPGVDLVTNLKAASAFGLDCPVIPACSRPAPLLMAANRLQQNFEMPAGSRLDLAQGHAR